MGKGNIPATELVGTWKLESQGQIRAKKNVELTTIDIAADDPEKLILKGQFDDWKVFRSYVPLTGEVDFVRTVRSIDEIDKVALPDWAKRVAVEGYQEQLEWKLSLRVENTKRYWLLGDKCDLRLHGTIRAARIDLQGPGPAEGQFDDEAETDVVVVPRAHTQDVKELKKVRYAFPPTRGWLEPRWQERGEAEAALGAACEQAILTEVRFFGKEQDFLSDFGRFEAEMFKSIFRVVGKAWDVAGVEGWLARFGFELIRQLGITTLKGEQGTKAFAAAVGAMLGRFLAKALPDAWEDLGRSALEFASGTAAGVTPKSFERAVENYLKSQCRFEFSTTSASLGGTKTVSALTALVDTALGTADIVYFLPEHTYPGGTKCPWAVVSGSVSGLPETDDEFFRTWNKPSTVFVSVTDHG